jgi:hypothetical protein
MSDWPSAIKKARAGFVGHGLNIMAMAMGPADASKELKSLFYNLSALGTKDSLYHTMVWNFQMAAFGLGWFAQVGFIPLKQLLFIWVF